MKQPQDQPGESHDGEYGSNDARHTAGGTNTTNFSYEATTMCLTTMTKQFIPESTVNRTRPLLSRTAQWPKRAAVHTTAAKKLLPERSAAASARDSERRGFLCRGPNLARDCPVRNKQNGKDKKCGAKDTQKGVLSRIRLMCMRRMSRTVLKVQLGLNGIAGVAS